MVRRSIEEGRGMGVFGLEPSSSTAAPPPGLGFVPASGAFKGFAAVSNTAAAPSFSSKSNPSSSSAAAFSFATPPPPPPPPPQFPFAFPSSYSTTQAASQSGAAASGERPSLLGTVPPNSAGANSSTPINIWSSNSNLNNIGFKETIEDLKRQISYLSGCVAGFKQQTPTDIQLKPNDDGPCIPAHRAILEARSKICKSMLDSNGFKAPPPSAAAADDIVTLSELNTEQVGSLLEFVYTGNLHLDKLDKLHVYSLYVAAKNYEIPNLEQLCERYMLSSLKLMNTTSNAVNILELSHAHSNKTLKEASLNFIVENMKEIVCSNEYEELARANPDLSLQITRAFVTKASIDAQAGFRAMMRDHHPLHQKCYFVKNVTENM